jgi:hypothetical protein
LAGNDELKSEKTPKAKKSIARKPASAKKTAKKKSALSRKKTA